MRDALLLLSEGVESVENGAGLWVLEGGNARDSERENRWMRLM